MIILEKKISKGKCVMGTYAKSKQSLDTRKKVIYFTKAFDASIYQMVTSVLVRDNIWESKIVIVAQGPSINYVGKILPIFDPLRRQVYHIILCSSIGIWLTPLPLACLRSLWMPPNVNFQNGGRVKTWSFTRMFKAPPPNFEAGHFGYLKTMSKLKKKC